MAKRYQRIQVLDSKQGNNTVRYYATTKYPTIPLDINDIYVITTVGDRYDTLANTFYSDPQLWWIISIANGSLNQNSIVPPIGSQIRIPSNPAKIISLFNALNSTDVESNG